MMLFILSWTKINIEHQPFEAKTVTLSILKCHRILYFFLSGPGLKPMQQPKFNQVTQSAVIAVKTVIHFFIWLTEC